jgi:hypothetical protein
VAYDSDEVGDKEMVLVLRVSLDCLPVIRRRVIAALAAGAITEDESGLSTSRISGAAQFSATSIRRTLEDLQALEVVHGHKMGQGRADEWELNDCWVDVFKSLNDPDTPSYFSGTPLGDDEEDGDPGFSVTVPEMSEGLVGTDGSEDDQCLAERFGKEAAGSPALTAYRKLKPKAAIRTEDASHVPLDEDTGREVVVV